MTVSQSHRARLFIACLTALLLVGILPAQAGYKDDVGYTALESELSTGMPDGAGVRVSQIEASVQSGEDLAWMPDPGHAEFGGKTITDASGATPGVYSSHATSVGRKFFGNATSTSAGITDIAAFVADDWITTGFLRTNFGSWPVFQPLSSASRISNHSWIGSMGSFSGDALARLDWAIETDEIVQAAGFTGNVNNALLGSAYNVISVNQTGAPTDAGSASAGGIYTSGRTKPEIVAPAVNTSSATPRVASASALLIDAAHGNPGWSTDPAGISTTNRNGDTIYNAERVEVIKAALMAGADRETSNTSSTDITDYRIAVADQTVNGLDRRFGAGQLNVHYSYHAIAAGEQNSIEDNAGGAGLIGLTGFDYDPAFGGANGSNSTATYYFATTSGPARLTASLAWNLEIDGGTTNNFDDTATLYDLDLQLFDVTNPGGWVLVGSSQSTNENTENLWQLVDGGKDYALRVEPGATQTAFNWDYGLAWKVASVVPLAIVQLWPPQGNLDAEYTPFTLTASGGQTPYTWSIVAGALPPGLTLSPDGVISGTPTAVTIAVFTVQVTDHAGATAAFEFQIIVKPVSSGCYKCHGFSSL